MINKKHLYKNNAALITSYQRSQTIHNYAGKIKVAAVRCFPQKHYDYEGVNILGFTVAIRKGLMPTERANPLPDQHGTVMRSIFI